MQRRTSGKQVGARMNQRKGQSSLGVLSAGNESRPITNSGGPDCKAHSAMQRPWQEPQTRSTATALAVAHSGKQNGAHANAGLSSYRTLCCLTPRSRRGPTAGHQARSGGTRTFSPARAWRPAVGPASPQTLGVGLASALKCNAQTTSGVAHGNEIFTPVGN